MPSSRAGLLSAAILALFATSAQAAALYRPVRPMSVAELAGRIDELLAASWQKAGVEPAPLADDAEFLRRAYLDLGGRIPAVSRVRSFLDDGQPYRRQRLVNELLAGPYYINHFTTMWRSLLLPEANANRQSQFFVPSMEAWIRERVRGNVPYDVMVRELITAPYGPNVSVFNNGARTSAIAFYYAKEAKPENLAANTARLFLGIKLECAQCHNHPFAAWKREQFWSFAAFYSGLTRQSRGGDFVQFGREIPNRRQLTIPGTDHVVSASFPDGTEPPPPQRTSKSSRALLAAWITSANNPYFARATANRIWAHFFGIGLADPVDEIAGGQNPPSHPELLDELARQLVAHRFDLKFLMRAIAASKAYQRTSSLTHKSQENPQQFARMAVRGLTAEQLYDCLAEATAFREEIPKDQASSPQGSPMRVAFLAKFTSPSEKPTDVQTSILQALTLMNGRLVADATSLGKSETLAAVLDAPFLDTAGRVETLYLAALSRLPRPREASRAREFIDAALTPQEGESPLSAAERSKRYQHALADVFWALLNSGEFYLNH